MASTDMRGFRVENGSWKTIWNCGRKRRNSCSGMPAQVGPLENDLPRGRPLQVDDTLAKRGLPAAGLSHVEGGGRLRRWSAKNCDAEFISDLLSVFLSTLNLYFSSYGSNWQRGQFLFHPCLAQTVTFAVGLDDMTSVG